MLVPCLIGINTRPRVGTCDQGRSVHAARGDIPSGNGMMPKTSFPCERPPLPSETPDPAAPFAVIVMGVSGCGKSTLGALLGEALDCAFLEGDAYHSAASVQKMERGEPLTDEDRWPWLDRVGRATATAARTGGVAVAACSALRKCYRDRLVRTIGNPTCFLLLNSSRDMLLQRLVSRTGHYMPASLLDSQLATLEQPLAEELVLTLDASAPPSSLLHKSLTWIAAIKPYPEASRH